LTVSITTGCTACGACLATCPTGALLIAPLRPQVDDRGCIDCWACIEICPADAIKAGPAQPSAAW
jgi:ferredoxin